MRRTVSLLLLAACLLPCLTGCTAGADQRTGEAEGYGGKLRVTVSLNGEDITNVKVVEHHETPGVGTRAIDSLPGLIAEKDSADVDSVSGATITSEAIKMAVRQALGITGTNQPTGMAANTGNPSGLMGMGMAATGRIGPGKDAEGKQVYSLNVVFACGDFAQDGTIRAIRVDQLELVTPNLGGGNAFAGFPETAGEESDFLNGATAWKTKGMLGKDYMLKSGSWREEMDAYEQAMVGKTVSEVKEWYANRGKDNADAQTDVTSAATMSLQGQYGDILLAIERAWEDARRMQSGHGNTILDTNTVTESTDGGSTMG